MKITLKKGLDLSLAGAVTDPSRVTAVQVDECAIIPDDFWGLVPKLELREGDPVAKGQPLLHDKDHEELKVVSPVSGTVKAIVRGERRRILRVVISVGAGTPKTFDTNIGNDRNKALGLLCESGLLACMRQRPYDIVPNPEVMPRDIFVNAMDTAPLSPGLATLLTGKERQLAEAVKLLKLVTKGKVYICSGNDISLGNIPGAEMVEVSGPHPAGTVGAQIANIAPVNKGEVVWTLDAVTLARIGTLLTTGQVDTDTIVAVTGSEVNEPAMLSTVEGAKIGPLISGRIKDTDRHIRIISGNVLTGTAVDMDGYLHWPYRQITVIPEGDDVGEFMGWASLSPKKMSASRSFPGHFFGKLFRPDARILGGRRAMIMSEEFDRVMPMDIMPEYLLKAIMAHDIEQMEKLGIYEVAPEDFALAEYVDTSKQPLQQIVREGLDYLRKELN